MVELMILKIIPFENRGGKDKRSWSVSTHLFVLWEFSTAALNKSAIKFSL